MDKGKFIASKVQGKSNKQAALDANPDLTDKSAEVVGSRMANDEEVKLAIQKSATQALADAGLGIDDFISTIKEARGATKLIVHGKNAEDGWTEEVPDWTARLKATDMGLKLMQSYTPIKPTEDKQPDQVITPEFKKALKARDVKELQRIVFNSEDK